MTQAVGERPAERYGYGDIETPPDHRQAELLTGSRGDADAGIAGNALPGFIDDLRVREIL